jgi:hypothetical protein
MKYTINVILLAIVVLFSSFKLVKEKPSAATINSDPTITITTPAGGQDYCLNEQQNIVWETSGGTVASVSIYLMRPDGQTIDRTIVSDLPNNGSYLWNRDASGEGNYFIKISGLIMSSDPAKVISGQTAVFTLKDCQKPDLRVGMMGAMPIGSGVIGEGQRIKYKGEIVNSGETTVNNPTVKMILDRPGNEPTNQFTTELNVTIEKDDKANFEKGFRVHTPGTYTVTLVLDPENSIDELDENNNSRTRSFDVPPLPDLIVYIDNAKRPPVGREREVRIVVKNIGNSATSPYANASLRSYVKQKGVENYDIPVLQPGATFTIKRKHKWGTAGTKKINAKVSYSQAEINADNNFVEGSFFVRLPHHDTYTAAPKVKCSTGETFYSWNEIEN